MTQRSASHWLTRARHRLADGADLFAFSMCPLDSWTTDVYVNNQKLGDHSPNDTSRIRLKIEQWTALGSGGFVWDGARRLAGYMQINGDGQVARSAVDNHNNQRQRQQQWAAAPAARDAVTSRSWGGLNVIELGAGTGALGLAIAALGANVTLTDQAHFVFPNPTSEMMNERKALKTRSLLDLMRLNVQQNKGATQQAGQQDVQVHEILWGGDGSMLAELPHRTYDVIIASDVLLFTDAQEALLATLRSLSTSQTVVLIEHTDRSDTSDEYPADLLHFLKLMAEDTKAAWSYEIINDHGRHITLRICSTPPTSQ